MKIEDRSSFVDLDFGNVKIEFSSEALVVRKTEAFSHAVMHKG